MNEVRAAKESESKLNGQEYVNLCSFVREVYEAAHDRKNGDDGPR